MVKNLENQARGLRRLSQNPAPSLAILRASWALLLSPLPEVPPNASLVRHELHTGDAVAVSVHVHGLEERHTVCGVPDLLVDLLLEIVLLAAVSGDHELFHQLVCVSVAEL